MAVVTSVMRVQQLLLSRIEDTLKPYGLTFAAYEALQLLAFTRSGSLPMGKMGERLMVHPASVTNAISRLEQRRLVERHPSADDRRGVLASITPGGRALGRRGTTAPNPTPLGRGVNRGRQPALERGTERRAVRATENAPVSPPLRAPLAVAAPGHDDARYDCPRGQPGQRHDQ